MKPVIDSKAQMNLKHLDKYILHHNFLDLCIAY